MVNKKIIGYKFIGTDMKSQNGGTKWRKNIWKKHKGTIEICEQGFHACRTPLQSLDYTYGGKWYIVEAQGNIKEEKEDKFVASEMRLIQELPIKKILVEFAIRCAERNIKNFEKEFPNDKRPREAINAAKKYIKNPCKKTKSATQSAQSAAESVAQSTQSAAESVAESAVWSAVWSAWSAESAARSAAGSVAESAVQSAAGSAAESAAQSAESAARSATWSAWSAGSAEKKWQNRILKAIIKRVLEEVEGK